MERFDCVSTENQERADALEREICLSSAQAHAAMARVTAAAAEFDEIGGWGAGGIKSFPHWLAIWAGFDSNTGAELLRVGQALRALPLLSAAFAAGELSFDKVRQATSVATPDTDELMTREQVERLLARARAATAALVDEVVPGLLRAGELQRVLQNLLREQVSIRDAVSILEALGEAAPTTRNPIAGLERISRNTATPAIPAP